MSVDTDTASTHRIAYPDYRNTGVDWLGNLPTHWEVKRFKHLVMGCQNGTWGDEPVGDETDIVCVRVADFDRRTMTVSDARLTMRSVPPEDAARRKLRPGDLLLEKSGGGDLQPVGFVVLFRHDFDAVCSNFVARMRPAPSTDARYLRYLHAAAYALRLNVRSIKQTTGIQNLDADAYLSEPSCCPPLSEQRAIAAFLDRETAALDALVAKKRRPIALLAEKRAALIARAVTRGLDPATPTAESGVGWLGAVPEHWEIKRFKHLVNGCQNGVWGEEPLSDGSDVVCVRVADFNRMTMTVRNDRLTLRSVSPQEFRSRRLKPGDLLLEKSGGGDLQPVGFVVLFDLALDAVCSNFVARMQPREGTDSRYLRYLHAAAYASRLNLRSIKQTTGIQNLDADSYLSEAAVCPPYGEQVAIADFLDRETAKLDDLGANLRETIARLGEYRTGLIAAAVTGQIDVRAEFEGPVLEGL